MQGNQRKKQLFLAFLLLSVLWTGWIFGNSLKTVEDSRAQSIPVMEAVEPVLEKVGVEKENQHNVVRKAAHLTEFAVLGALWFVTLSAWGCAPVRAAGRGLELCLLTALVDETCQYVHDGRGPEVRDIWIDTGGAAAALVLLCILCWIWQAVRKQRT